MKCACGVAAEDDSFGCGIYYVHQKVSYVYARERGSGVIGTHITPTPAHTEAHIVIIHIVVNFLFFFSNGGLVSDNQVSLAGVDLTQTLRLQEAAQLMFDVRIFGCVGQLSFVFPPAVSLAG